MTSNKTHITEEIYDLIISKGLSFNLAQKPRFDKMLGLTRNLTRGCQPPNINLIPKDLLGVIHDHTIEKKLSLIKKD